MTFQKPSHTFTKIHLKALRTNILQILFALSFTVFININGVAQERPVTTANIKPERTKDTTASLPDSKPLNLRESDSIEPDTIIKPPQMISDVVTYKAKDYVSMNQKTGKITLYNEALVLYQDMEITSGTIVIDNNTNLVYAGRIKDTAGNYSQKPVFKQGQNVIEPDSIVFNVKTQKALIFNSRSEQSGGFISSEVAKKENDSVFFLSNMRFTTAQDEEDPEYWIQTRKAKVVPNKKVVTGSSNLYFYGVPTPIYVPFAFFPLTKKQTSGIIFPSFGEETANDRGYFIQNGGYYFAISDYVDLAVLGDYYTNGSYGLRVESNYALRYRFRGNLSFRFENLITSERGFPDYATSSVYNLRWSHNQDAKANPNSRFSASVNLGSSTYYQDSANQLNQANFLNNTLSSSVSYSKTFEGDPVVNLNLSATHTQNTNTETINMTLPTLQASMGRVYPFEPKVGSKKGIIQNINFQYNLRGENRIQTTDSLFFKSEMFDEARLGMQHSIPISTNFKVFNYFSVSANANFEENWTYNTIERYYDVVEEEEVTEDKTGFDRFSTYNFNASIGTTIYGMFPFKKEGKDPKIQAIRHVMRPSLSYNINPSFDEYYDSFEIIDADGTTLEEYTRFEEFMFGSPGQNYSSSVGLTLGNNFEAKVRDKDSTATEAKKIQLLNNLNFSTSYNIAGDSLNWSPVRISGGTQILNDKMNINFGMVLDPYALDNNNTRIDKFNIDNGGSLFRMTSANMNISYNLSSDSFSETEKDKRGKNESLRSGGRADDLFGKTEDFADRRLGDDDNEEENQGPIDAYNYNIPWSLRLAYAVNYSNSARQNEISSHSLMFSGDIEIAPRWKVGASSGYDFQNKGFTYTQLRFERDLLSWRMNFTWVPFSDRSSWNFFIGIKSSLLKDLKYDKRKQPDQSL